ncbi:MAG: hypothetical protein SGARI_004560 [Bacillariaceae sp.]
MNLNQGNQQQGQNQPELPNLHTFVRNDTPFTPEMLEALHAEAVDAYGQFRADIQHHQQQAGILNNQVQGNQLVAQGILQNGNNANLQALNNVGAPQIQDAGGVLRNGQNNAADDDNDNNPQGG